MVEAAQAALTDARRDLARAMVAIGRAANPRDAFESHEQLISSALHRLGHHSNLARWLSSLVGEGLSPAVWSMPRGSLPTAAHQSFCAFLHSALGKPATRSVTIRDVLGNADEGYSFAFERGAGAESAFALFYSDQWFFSPGPVGKDDLDTVTQAMRRYFDVSLAIGLHERGQSNESILKHRDSIVPTRTLWGEEKDPREAMGDLPLVFVSNPIGVSRRRLYCGYDPMEDNTVTYDAES